LTVDYGLLQLRRITSSGRFVPEIDGLRFVAIASVVLYHFHGFVAHQRAAPGADSVQRFVEHGYRGVNLFYVISGFILGLPFAARHLQLTSAGVSLKSYFLRRITRLEVPYLLNLLICFAVMAWSSGTAANLLPHLGASMVYLHSFIFGAQNPVNPVVWTLEVEVQFYCLAPLLAWIFKLQSRTGRRAILLVLILSAGLLQMLYWDAPARIKLSILYAIQFFLTGYLLADIYLVDWKGQPATCWRWDLASLASWPIVFFADDRVVWTVLPLLLLVGCQGAFSGSLFNRFFRSHTITILGGMCYSIYLFHYVLIPPLLRVTGGLDPGGGFNVYFLSQTLLYLMILLVVSGAFFVLVERPCMTRDWPQRLARRMSLFTGVRQSREM
jgi:peptidoglycan/LPS O-acetylase OafA/YrhL